MVRLIVWSVMLVFLAGKVSADAGEAGASFLKIAAGAKAASLGEAYSAAAEDVYAVYWNPAGLSKLEERQATFMHNKWLVDVNYEFIAYAQPLKLMKQEGVLAVSLIYLDCGDIERYKGKDMRDGNFSAKDIAVTCAYGKPVNDQLSIGGSVKLISQKIESEKATAFAIDLGGLYKSQVAGLQLAGVLQNLGTKVKFISQKDSLPMNIKIGGAYRAAGDKLLICLDLNKPVDNDLRINTGVEYSLTEMLALRLGYNSGIDEGSGLTSGIGFKINTFNIDYAFVPYGDIDDTHRISLTTTF